jgi:sugar/nucleoside kinase (ribokinase family)
MSAPKTTVVAGHICLDVIPGLDHLPEGRFEQLFQPGHLIAAGTADFSTGGPVSNTGLALHRLDVPTRLIAKVGDDPFGEMICRLIRACDPGLLAGIHVDGSSPTSYSIIISPPGVDRIFLHCPGVNDTFRADDIDNEIVAQADLMHFGYPPIMRQMYLEDGAELVAVFEQAKASGVTTSLDMAFPDPASEGGRADWHKILQAALPFVDIFTPSFEEILFLLHREQYESLCRQHADILTTLTPAMLSELGDELFRMGSKIVLLKLGHQGAYLRTAGSGSLQNLGRATPENLAVWTDQEIWSPCYQVEVVGTTGSGDATIAGFLSAFLREMAPKDALNAAVAVGACNVEAPDALSGLCSWEATLDRIQQGWKKHPLQVDAPGWVWEAESDLWVREGIGVVKNFG